MPLSRRRAIALGAGSVALGAARGAARAESPTPPEKPAELKVRTWSGVWLDSLRRGVSDPFTEVTGVPVTHLVLEDHLVAEQVLAALEAGESPPIYVDWNTTVNLAQLAAANGTEDLSDLAGLEQLLPIARPDIGTGWPWVNTYAYVYALAYRQAAFPGGAPTSWHVLTDPDFEGRVALFDDGVGFYSAAQIAGGGTLEGIPDDMSACWSFLEQVSDNRPRLGKDPDFTAWLAGGEVDACVTVTADARAARLQGADVAWTIPREGAELDTDGLAVPRGLAANERYWAMRYVEFALSRSAQRLWCDGLGLPPVHPGLEPPADLIGDPTYPTTADDFGRFLQIPLPVRIEHQEQWYARFQTLMRG